jgi:hypothetical protein
MLRGSGKASLGGPATCNRKKFLPEYGRIAWFMGSSTRTVLVVVSLFSFFLGVAIVYSGGPIFPGTMIM